MIGILATVKELENLIRETGAEHKNTLELLDVTLVVVLRDLADPNSDMDLTQEQMDLRVAYGEEAFESKREEEMDHYEQLKFSLIHKIKEIKYFFGLDPENRKAIVFSNDCISMLHYLKRGKDTSLNVYMRSSDVVALLPLDLLFLCYILRAVNTRFFGDEALNERVKVWIGSAHVYTSGGRA